MEAAGATKKAVAGEVPPRSQQWWNTGPQESRQPAAQPRASVSEVGDSPESRALVALGYPLFPLAVLSLFDRKQSKSLRKHAYQAIGFNLGMAVVAAILSVVVNIPIISWTPLGWSSYLLAALLLPVWVMLSVYYGIKAWHGDEVRVPIISDWLDDRMPA